MSNGRLNDRNEEVHQQIRELGPKTDQLRIRLSEEEFKFKEDFNEAKKLKKELKTLEDECVRLKSKLKFLNENFDFQSLLKKIKIDDLKSTISNNLIVNDTINNLLSKWDNIRNFGSGLE